MLQYQAGGSDYGYATVTGNNYEFPEYDKVTGRFIYAIGNGVTKDYIADTILKGGNEYYLVVGYRKDASSASYQDQFSINSIKIYGLNCESTELEINGGRVEVTTDNYSYPVCAIYNEDNLKITNGVFYGYNTNSSSNGFGIYNLASLEISGGTFMGKSASSSSSSEKKAAGIYNKSMNTISISNAQMQDSYNGFYNEGADIAHISNVNITNCSYRLRNYSGNYIILSGYCKLNNGYIQNYGMLTIEGADISGYIQNYKNTIMHEGNITGTTYGIVNYEAGILEVDGGTINANTYGIYFTSSNSNSVVTGSIHIVRGTIKGASYGIFNYKKAPMFIGKNDGIVDNSQVKIIGETKKGIISYGEIEFYDGIIEGKENAILGTINKMEDGYSIILENSEEITEGEKATLGIQTGIAYIEPNNTILYDNIQAVIDACGENETITLVKDIVVASNEQNKVIENKNIIINLNGKQIKTFGTLFTNYGKIKLTDLTEEANGVITNYGEVGIVNETFAQLDIERIKILSVLDSKTAKMIYNHGELNIESGNLESISSSGYGLYNEGKLGDNIAEDVLGEWENLGDYYFAEKDGNHVSNNKIKNTTANSYVKVDLRGKSGIYHLTVHTTMYIFYANQAKAYATIKDNNNEIVSYDDTEGRFMYFTDAAYSSKKDFTILLPGEKEYYLYFGFVNEHTSAASVVNLTINDIEIREQFLAITNMKNGKLDGSYCIYNELGKANVIGGEIQSKQLSIYNYLYGETKIDGGIITTSNSSTAIQNDGYLEMNEGTINTRIGIQNNNTGTVKMTGGTINAIVSSYEHVGISNSGTLEMIGGEINVTGYNSNNIGIGIRVEQNGITKINGGAMTLGNYANGVRNVSTASVEITKMNITGIGANSYGVYNVSTGEIILGQKNETADLENIIIKINNGCGISNKLGSLKFYDGIVGGKEGKSIEGPITDYEEKYTVVTYRPEETEIYEIEENQEISLLERIYVAHVASNDTRYENIYEAMENLASIDTLTVLYDVSLNEDLGPLTINEDKEIVLDLNGCNIKGNTQTILLNKGKLTLKDSKGGATLLASYDGIHNDGILDIEDGIINITTDQCYGIYNNLTIGEEITREVLGELTSVGEYYFEERDGKYVSNNKIHNTCANSYMKIDLKDKEGVYVLDINTSVSSYSSNYGYVTLREQNTEIPAYNNENDRLIYISGTKTQDKTVALVGGREYYLYFGYAKNNSTITGNDEFVIESLKIYKNKTKLNIRGGSIKTYITTCINTSSGIYTYGIKNNASIEISGGDIDVFGDNTQSNRTYSYGINNDGWINITGGTITVEAKAIYNSSYSKSANAYGIMNNSGGNVKYSGESMKSTSNDKAFGIYNDEKGILKVTGGEIESTANGTSRGYGIYNYSMNTLEIEGGRISSFICIYNYYNAGNIKMTGGTLIASNGNAIYNYSKDNIIEVTGGNISVIKGSYAGIYTDQICKIIVGEKDGVFHSDTIKISSTNWYGIYQNALTEFNYYDGTIIGKDIAIYGPINEIEEEYSLILESTEEIASGEMAVLGNQNAVAYISSDNTVLYNSIQEAIDACGNEGTIILAKDMTIVECQKGITDENSKITFDLNGKCVRAYGCVVDNYGTMKLIDTVEDSTGKLYGYARNIVMNENTGTMTNENAIIENNYNVLSVSGIYNKGDLYIKGGIVEANGARAIHNDGSFKEKIDESEVLGELVNVGEYFFNESDGKYIFKSSINTTKEAISYVKLDLRNKEGYYFVTVDATISASSSDYGFVMVRDTNEQVPTYTDRDGRIIYISNNTTSEKSYRLTGGREYYLYLGYKSYYGSSNGTFSINSIKIYKNMPIAEIEGGKIEGYCGIYNNNTFLNIINCNIRFSNYGIYEDSTLLVEMETIKLMNGTINATTRRDSYGIYHNAYTTISINGGTINTSNGYGVYNAGPGTLKINEGNITAYAGIGTNESGTLEMNDGNINSSYYGVYIYGNYNNRGITKIKGGNIVVSNQSNTVYGIYSSYSYGSVIIGELDEEEPSNTKPNITATSETENAYGIYIYNQQSGGKTCFYDGILNGSTAAISGTIDEIPEHYRISLKNNGKTAILEVNSDFENTIQVNGIFYASLQEAVNAIAESSSKEGTILLWDDLRSLTDGVIIPENVKVTLALEGHIVQFQDLSTAITNNGTFSIIDYEDVEEGDADTTSIVKNTTGIVIANNGTLTIGQEGNKNANSPVIEGVPAVSGTAPEIKSGKLVNTTVSGASGSLNGINKIAGSRKDLLSGILEILGNTRLSSEVELKPNSVLPNWTKDDVNVDLSASAFGILNLYLDQKAAGPKDISYTVEYYKVDVKVEEDTVIKTETVLETDPNTLTFDRSLITNNDKYTGYCIDRTEPATVPDTVNHGDVIKVYYKIDETKVKELSYTVEYYKANVKVEEDTVITKQNVQILQPDTITIDRNLINNNSKYYGYCIDRTEPSTVPDVVNTGTTIKVYYKIDTTKTKELNYTVEYYKANVKVTSDTVVRRQTVQVLQPDTIAIDRTLLTNNSKYYGYCLDRTEPSTVPDTVNTGTIIKVYYKVDNNQTKQLSYTVEYYKDGAKVTGDTIVRRETVQVLQPDTIMVDRSLITNNNKYTNYCIERTNPDVVPERVNSGTTIKVYYMRVGSPTKQLSYTVEYYKNEALMSRDTVTRRVTVQTSEPDTLPIDRSLITNNNKYYGYCIDRTDPEIVPDVVDTGTIVRVYYKVDETQTKEIFYTVDYYKEHVKVEEDTVIIRETVQVLYPDMLDFDRSLITDNDKYPGYYIEEIDPAEVPDRVHDKQIISVNYEIDETKTKDLSYTVEYYKDNIQMEEDTVVVTEAVQILLPDILPLDMSLVTNNDKYPGYCIERTDPEMLSNRVHDGDVIKVYYVIDSMQTKELSYTVEYYKDNNKVEEDTIIITKRVHLLDVDTIETERTLFTDNDKYLGYHLERTEPEEVPEVVDNGTVIKVYYEKTAYAYRVEYYYNGQIDESLTEQGTAYLGDTIQECPSKPKEGYEFDRTENLPLEISLVRENVIRVYYVAVRKVTVEHIEKETEEVLEQEVKVGKQGTLIRTEARKIEGYTLVEKPEKEEYILGNEDMVVRYYYEKVKQEPEPTPQEDEKEPEEEQPTPTEPEERQEEPEPKETHVIPVTPDEPTIDNTTTPTKLPRTGYHRIIIPLVWVITIAGLVFYNKYQSIGKKKKKK